MRITSLEDSLSLQRTNQIAQQRSLRARIHVQAQLNVELSRVHTEGNGWKYDYTRSAVPRDPRECGSYRVALNDIGRVRRIDSCAPR